MKLFALHTGDTKVPYGQFYGGADGWMGARGIWKMMKDKEHYIMVPIYVYLIDHPKQGLILVDTGINWRQANEHHQYYTRKAHQKFLDEDEYEMTRDQELSAHLKRLGYKLSDIKHVILTHLHEDHTGGLLHIPKAKVHVSPKEWSSRVMGFLVNKSPSIEAARQAGFEEPELIEFTHTAIGDFDKSADLFGDGSVTILPVPGHTPGHVVVLVDMGAYHVLCVGDTLYTLRHLATDQVQPFSFGKKAWSKQVASTDAIKSLMNKFDNLVIAPAHDHTEYSKKIIEPFLSDGKLTAQEIASIKKYVVTLFKENWSIDKKLEPKFVASSGRSTGTVHGEIGL